MQIQSPFFMLRNRTALHCLVLAAYALLTLGMTWPLAANIGLALPGAPPDTFLYIWNLEWVKRALFELGVNPYFTREIYYPSGVSLYFHSLILGNDLLALPLQFAFGSPAAYMLMTLGLIAASGYAVYLLALDLVRRPLPAFFAGLVFTFSPYRFAHLAYSHFDLMPLLWLPLFALAVKKLCDRPALVGLWPALLFLFWVAITNWYYALYAFIWFGLYMLYRLARGRAWRLAPWALAVPLLTLALLAPWLASMYGDKDAYPVSFRGVNEADKFSADLASYVLPSASQPIWGGLVAPLAAQMGGGPAERTVFLGYTTLALGVLAFVWRRGPELGFWCAAGLVFLVLSLGPFLHVGGASEFAAGLRLPLPYALFFQLPGLSSLFAIARSISRFGVMVMLCAGMVAAYGLAGLIARLSPRAGAAAALAACALALTEFLAIPVPVTSAAVPAAVQRLSSLPEGAVLDLPPDYKTGAEAMFYWTLDRRPTTNGYHSRLPPFPLLNGVPSLRSALEVPEPDDILLEPRPAPAQVLAFFNVRYLALHKQTAGKDFTDLSRQWIAQTFGALTPLAEDERVTLYPLPAASLPPLVASFGPGWYEPERGPDGRLLRWMQNDAHLFLYAGSAQSVNLQVDAFALGMARRSRFFLDGAQVLGARVPFDDIRHLEIPSLSLHAGLNDLMIRSLEPPELPAAYGINADPRPFTIAFARLRLAPAAAAP